MSKSVVKEKYKQVFEECSKVSRYGQVSQILKKYNIPKGTYYREKQKLEIPSFTTSSTREKLEKEIVADYLSNPSKTVTQIAEKHSMIRQTVSRILKKHGVDIQLNRRSSKLTTEDMRIKMLHDDLGFSIKEIQKMTKYSETKISNCLNGSGIKFRSREKTNVQFECLWCSKKDYSWVSKGVKTQKYCSSSCKNKIYDIRRGKRSKKGLEKLREEFFQTWENNAQSKWDKLFERIYRNS